MHSRRRPGWQSQKPSEKVSFGPAAEVLAQAALHTESPMTIGVFGNWGTGKTSLMRLMHEIVDNEGGGDRAGVPVLVRPG